MTVTPSDHVRHNRALWDRQAADWVESGRRAWADDEMRWGIWQIPEREIGAVPPVAGRDVLELGCGTAYWSAWLARRGAHVVGLDNSAAQLATAGMLQREHAVGFPLVHGDAEHAPFRDESFDVAISEYGAAIWCDPYRWIPEAARVLRPGGELVFLRNSVLFSLCAPDSEDPAGDRLLRGYFDLHRIEWSDDGAVNFSLGVGALLRLFRASGFEVLGCIEPRPAEGATTFFRYATPVWAHRWPSEEIWRVRKARGGAAGL